MSSSKRSGFLQTSVRFNRSNKFLGSSVGEFNPSFNSRTSTAWSRHSTGIPHKTAQAWICSILKLEHKTAQRCDKLSWCLAAKSISLSNEVSFEFNVGKNNSKTPISFNTSNILDGFSDIKPLEISCQTLSLTKALSSPLA